MGKNQPKKEKKKEKALEKMWPKEICSWAYVNMQNPAVTWNMFQIQYLPTKNPTQPKVAILECLIIVTEKEKMLS